MPKYDFVINGGAQLRGSIDVYGSKNAALPLITAALLTDKEVVLKNIPDILDVTRLLDIVHALGAQVERKKDRIILRAKAVDSQQIPTADIGLLRGSILLLGALLGRCQFVELPLPGGDVIGSRPIDTHLDAFAQLGAKIQMVHGRVRIDGRTLRAGRVILREFSVTATENVLLLAATLPGTTTISIAAAEPHVVALAQLLKKMGADIRGAGTHTIVVRGNKKLQGATFTNIPDMLEAGFFILLAAATTSSLTINNVPIDDLRLFFKKLDDIGIKYRLDEATGTVTVLKSTLRPFMMQSLPHPGIPTDLQAPFSIIATQAAGSSLIHDPLYEGRLKHIVELQKMGANAIICDPHRVIITGPTPLYGQTIPSLDIRSGATLVMAGLIAAGETVIVGADVIDRGFAQLAERLQNIGATIRRREAN